MNVSAKFNGTYDTILLSNISEYMYDEIPDTAGKIMAFYNNVLTPIADKNLNQNGGQICFNYAWCANSDDYAKMITTIQRYMKYSIDNFYSSDRLIDMVVVPTVCNESLMAYARPDIALTLTQKVR